MKASPYMIFREDENFTKLTERWRRAGFKLVFTNGCFDLLHIGHIAYLRAAAELGERLIVGLNSDASVKKLKGKNRPIKDEETRAHILASLEVVDAVIIFNADTPLEIIEKIKPHTLVKGGDWKPEQIVGSDIVLKNGGNVLSLKYIEGHSTTALEEKIKNS